MKKLLIISADPLSTTTSNGKTLESMIGCFQTGFVAQLFFAGTPADSNTCDNYFRITDGDIIRQHFRVQNVGKVVQNNTEINDSSYETKTRHKLKTVPLARLLREFIWNLNWNHAQKLNEWLDNYAPEVILFVGGDLLFMYSICNYVADRFKVPVIFQVTDDYLDRSCGLSICKRIIRSSVRKKFKKMLDRSSGFITIGDYMRDTYREKFGVDSMTFMNAVEIPAEIEPEVCGERMELIYAGSLYFGRENTLIQVRDSLERLSKKNIKGHISVYTSTSLTVDVLEKLDDKRCSDVMGYVSQEELKKRISKSNILLFMEDFSKENIQKTKLSVSTKLPEYMISGRPIFAIGPKEVGSMRYATEYACVCNSLDSDEIDQKLAKLILDMNYRQNLARIAFDLAVKNHSTKRNREEFMLLVENV